jgi:transposase
LVGDELWGIVEPLLPPEPSRPKGRRPRVPNRSALKGIVYVLKSGIPWRMLPKEFGYSGVTCWQLLRDWQKAACGGACGGCCSTSSGDSVSSTGLGRRWTRRAFRRKRGREDRPNPVDRGRPGSKRPLLVDRSGVPLAVVLTGAQVHDSKVFEEVVDGVEPVKESKGRPRKHPDKFHADKAYDFPHCQRFLVCAA